MLWFRQRAGFIPENEWCKLGLPTFDELLNEVKTRDFDPVALKPFIEVYNKNYRSYGPLREIDSALFQLLGRQMPSNFNSTMYMDEVEQVRDVLEARFNVGLVEKEPPVWAALEKRDKEFVESELRPFLKAVEREIERRSRANESLPFGSLLRRVGEVLVGSTNVVRVLGSTFDLTRMSDEKLYQIKDDIEEKFGITSGG